LLRSKNVEVVIDVRQLPLSRKRGFSKRQLSKSLGRARMDYFHFVNLGTPKVLREQLRNGGSLGDYTKEYNRVMQEQTVWVDELVSLAAMRRICLLCFERDATRCHRSLVAREMELRSKGKLRVEHITY
jgi:uncharacterized protein (DUF488 family)